MTSIETEHTAAMTSIETEHRRADIDGGCIAAMPLMEMEDVVGRRTAVTGYYIIGSSIPSPRRFEAFGALEFCHPSEKIQWAQCDLWCQWRKLPVNALLPLSCTGGELRNRLMPRA